MPTNIIAYQTDKQLDQYERFAIYLHATRHQIYYVRPPRYSTDDAPTNAAEAQRTGHAETQVPRGADKREEGAQNKGKESEAGKSGIAIRTKI